MMDDKEYLDKIVILEFNRRYQIRVNIFDEIIVKGEEGSEN